MPDGEREIQPQAAWLRVIHASVSRPAVAVVLLLAAVLVLAALAALLFFPRAAREQWVLEAALSFLRSTPPTDAIIAQLSPERWESVRVRGLAHVSRLLTPALLSCAVLFLSVALAYAWVARRLRALLSTLTIRPRAAVRWSAREWLIFTAIAACAILVHVPYGRQSIRFDEDFAGIFASSSWFAWANNVAGYANHVASSLTIRISTALFGLNELSVRAPAVLASSCALAFLCIELWRRFGAGVALTTAALFMSLPLWAEQTTLARGYGLSFTGAALVVTGLLRLQDECDEPSSASMLCLFAGVFIGWLAHGFFVFLVVGLFVCTALTSRLSAAVRVLLLWWWFLAGILPAASMAVGLPGMMTVTFQAGKTPFSAVVQRFVEELTYRHSGVAGTVLMSLWLLALVGSTLALSVRVRTPYLVILGSAALLPVLGNPPYIYPRFFLPALAFALPCVAWFLSARVLRGNAWLNAALLVTIVAVGLATQPWDRPPLVDLRAAARVAREQARVHGDHFAIDTSLVSGTRFYNGDAGRIASVSHPVPEDVQRLLLATPRAIREIPSGFAVEQRIEGTESDILLLARVDTTR